MKFTTAVAILSMSSSVLALPTESLEDSLEVGNNYESRDVADLPYKSLEERDEFDFPDEFVDDHALDARAEEQKPNENSNQKSDDDKLQDGINKNLVWGLRLERKANNAGGDKTAKPNWVTWVASEKGCDAKAHAFGENMCGKKFNFPGTQLQLKFDGCKKTGGKAGEAGDPTRVLKWQGGAVLKNCKPSAPKDLNIIRCGNYDLIQQGVCIMAK